MSDDRVKQACAYLRMLLLRPGEYRDAWQRRATPEQPAGQIDYGAVAQVLVQPDGHRESDGPVDEQVRETARLALEGSELRPETLNRFIQVFRLRPRQAERLTGLLSGSSAVRVITGEARTPAVLSDDPSPTRYESLSLHELHVLGPDGWPAEHQTIQVIRSTVDNLERLPYRFDTDELVVEVVRGGRVDDRVYQIGGGLYAVDILLPKPLAKGETTLIQYRSTFFYKSPPPPEFRRGVLSGKTEDLTMWLTFNRNRLPRRVWQARWDGVDHARIVDRERVELDQELSVHCRFDAVERAVVGFYWEWN